MADQPPEIQECCDWAVGPGTTDYSTTLGLIDLIWDRLDFLLRDTPLFLIATVYAYIVFQMQLHNVILLISYMDLKSWQMAMLGGRMNLSFPFIFEATTPSVSSFWRS